ncbi:M1 family aminopeptidase [Rapidithrix thailandica]|uniref:Aminopeptidase N n=1 Tax=Rapidithrix thailandica TaxID=413964 RepID=A0AAW9RNK2_9BACT
MQVKKRFLLPVVVLLFLFSCKTSQKSTNEPKPSIDITSEGGVPVDPYAPSIIEEEEEAPPTWVWEPGEYNPEYTRLFRLLNTKLEVRFDWEKQHLLGKATLSMQPYFYPQKKVVLDAKGFDIHRVALVHLQDTTELAYEYDSLQLSIRLDKEYQQNEKLHVYIDYTAKPNELKEGGSAAITSDKGLYFINPTGKEKNKPQQIWTQGETEANSKWFPTFDAPNVKSAQEMYITVDKKFTTLSNGRLVSQKHNHDGTRTDYWKQEKVHAPYLFMMTVGEFAKVQDQWKGIDVDYYVEPEYQRYAKDVFGNTPEMMEFFSTLFDYPYPWDKYAQIVVRDYVSGAMENTSASIFMEELQVDDRYLLDESWDYIIAHELIHHWFGDLVTCESWANLPLNESFANYGEYLWMEHKLGEEEADLHRVSELEQYLFESQSKRVPLIRYHHHDKENMFDSHSYAKGGLILHYLRSVVGDEAFFKALQVYLKQHEYGTAEVHELRLAFEQVTGQDLNWFFNQWFLASGHPELMVKDEFSEGEVTLSVRQLQDPQYTPIYTLPVTVAIWVNGQKTEHQITVTKKEQSFTFPVHQKPDLVLFDAQTVIPGKIDYIRSTESFVFQYKHAEKILARREALLELRSGVPDEANVVETYVQALNDPFWDLRQIAVDAFKNYQGARKEEVENKLRKLALEDPNSLVRASAVMVLSSYENQFDIFHQAMQQDSSYTVLSNAIFAYIDNNGPNIPETLAQFEPYNDLLVTISIANYYADQGTPGKYDWFVEKLNHLSGNRLQILLNYFGAYIIERPEEEQRKAVELLFEYLNDSSSNLRTITYQLLIILSELEGVQERVKAAIDQEKDPKVLENLRRLGEITD